MNQDRDYPDRDHDACGREQHDGPDDLLKSRQVQVERRLEYERRDKDGQDEIGVEADVRQPWKKPDHNAK